MSRFVNLSKREVEKLDLSGGDFILAKKVLTNAERRHINFAALKMTATPGDKDSARVDLDLNEHGFERILTYINEWSFKGADDKPVQFNRENLELLDEESYNEIVEALDTFVGEQEKEKNSDSPQGRRLKRVGSGTTSKTSP